MNQKETFLLFDIIPVDYIYIGVWIIIAILLFVGIFSAVNYLINGSDIVKFTKKKIKKLELDQSERNKKYTEGDYLYKQQKKTLLYKLDQRFKYSGLQKRFSFLSSGLWLVLGIVIASIVGLIVLAVSGNLLLCVVAAIIGGMSLYVIEGGLSLINYMSVEKDLSEFLNELKAYSVTTSDILTCFRAIANNMHDPLRSALNEFCMQAQATGEKSKAFYDLMNKIEHPMFKQIVRNLEICTRHSADYGVIVDNCRKTLRNYLKSRRDIDAQNKSEFMIMMLLVISGIFAISILRSFTGIDVWQELFHTVMGNVFLIVETGIFLVFSWSVLFSSKN